LVMESSVAEDRKDGYVRVEFFGTGAVSQHLRDTDECVRPFFAGEIDSVVAKHKKKHNNPAFSLACAEWKAVVGARNAAAVYYAEKAINMANNNQRSGLAVIGQRVQIHRSAVIDPNVDTVVGTVRRYSSVQKKLLVSFEMSSKSKTKYDAAWINLKSKACALKILDKEKVQITVEDLVPFVYGFEHDDKDEAEGGDYDDTAALAKLLSDCCRGCVEYWKKDDTNKWTCDECGAAYHAGCFDPPLSRKMRLKMAKEGTPLICSLCTPCRGCYQKDIVFGTHLHSPPRTLLFPAG
jgi:LysM repeat protein